MVEPALSVASIVAGIIFSGYAVYVEHRTSLDADYEALCDISEKVSCSKVFTSDYGHILSQVGLVSKGSSLDLPNAALGFFFYLVYLVFYRLFRNSKLGQLSLLGMSVLSLMFSAYLSVVLATVLHEFCVVCTSSYVCNFGLFVSSAMLNFQSTSKHKVDVTKKKKKH
jgi:vitamin-K-epoxide reductase (warfarin-sensitive)